MQLKISTAMTKEDPLLPLLINTLLIEGDYSTGPVLSGTEDEDSHPFEGIVQAEHFYCDIVYTQ